MLKNFIKIAFRNIRRNPVYSVINILGLAIGLASAIVIGLWVHRESSYDRQFDHADRIYRVGVSFMDIGDMAPGPEQFNETAHEMPEVQLAASLSRVGPEAVYVGSETFKEPNIFFADSTFFDLFSYSFVAGNSKTALDSPNTVVLTQKIAKKYFPYGQAMGQTIKLGDDKKAYTVTGVIKKTGNSHISAELFFHFVPAYQTNWLSARYYNYVLLRKGVTQAEFQHRLNQLVKSKIYPTLGQKQPYDEWIKTDAAYHFIPMPITDIYLKSKLRFDLNTGGNETNVFIFGIVSLFILLIAAVNFINITTARASNRAKEVGVRKSLGSRRFSLVGQFLAESVITGLIALLISFGLSELFLATFEKFTGVELLHSIWESTSQIMVISGGTILIGILAGIYPAFYLSSFRPTEVLKGRISMA
ncbi:MAG: ABC transporter permease, partial [Balneolaceae bacterium]